MQKPLCFAVRLVVAASLVASTGSCLHGAEVPDPAKKKGSAESDGEGAGTNARFKLTDLLPTAWQKRPNVRFNVSTEMTPEGRSRLEPTPEKPLTYFSPPGTYVETGWYVSAGEKPPPWPQLEEAMRTALAGNGYRPVTYDHQRPDLLIVFTFGTHSTDLAQIPGVNEDDQNPSSAEDFIGRLIAGKPWEPKAAQDVIARARFIGGDRVANELA